MATMNESHTLNNELQLTSALYELNNVRVGWSFLRHFLNSADDHLISWRHKNLNDKITIFSAARHDSSTFQRTHSAPFVWISGVNDLLRSTCHTGSTALLSWKPRINLYICSGIHQLLWTLWPEYNQYRINDCGLVCELICATYSVFRSRWPVKGNVCVYVCCLYRFVRLNRPTFVGYVTLGLLAFFPNVRY